MYTVRHIVVPQLPAGADLLIDAVPKKRGPKTDVLEALLKRVDGLEKRLHSDDAPPTPTNESMPDLPSKVEVDAKPPPKPPLNLNINTQEANSIVTPTSNLTSYVQVHSPSYQALTRTDNQRPSCCPMYCSTSTFPGFIISRTTS